MDEQGQTNDEARGVGVIAGWCCSAKGSEHFCRLASCLPFCLLQMEFVSRPADVAS
ncbi:hypothetical protein COLO4_22342 [Corchorus olitorius]|uniref:Uncharacterized protein n=1 Tax=Corchorus olitorius TaxID=93759 RepID=A0A1R3IMU2_9ROSI|nr:hypothetical protein COLO4_22342 [Corchorus olitorius]